MNGTREFPADGAAHSRLRGCPDWFRTGWLQYCRNSLASRGIDVCDLTPELRERAKSGPQLYLRVGAHWTDAGNEAAADVIAGCLARLNVNEASHRADAGSARPPRT